MGFSISGQRVNTRNKGEIPGCVQPEASLRGIALPLPWPVKNGKPDKEYYVRKYADDVAEYVEAMNAHRT